MLFTEFKFFIAMPVIFVFYWLIPIRIKSAKKLFLLVVSYLFYINFNPSYALLLLMVSFTTFFGAKILDKDDKRAKIGRIVVIITLSPLLIFKYYNFINESFFSLLSLIHLRFQLPGMNWAIPVGISFFTFQALGYFFDVYQKKISVEKNILDYFLFISFFPQIVSGPISMASELLPQLKKLAPFSYAKAVRGCRYFLWGLFLKIVLADRADLYVSLVFNHYELYSGLNCLVAAFLYSIQIYADFAGYTFMAIGTAKLLGFDLVSNFNHPYFSTSVTDFWRRWHISLSRWLKNYVYIPLGGNRCSEARNYLNIIITFLVSGIWHGANWTFIFWGLSHGLFQVIEKKFGLQKCESKGMVRAIRSLATFFIITFAWIVFRCPTITDALNIMYRIAMFYKEHSFSTDGFDNLANLIIAFFPFLLFEIIHEFYKDLYCRIMHYKVVRWMIYIALLSMIILIGVFDGSQFIYANF